LLALPLSAAVTPLFSPTDSIRGAWLSAVGSAQNSIHLAMYDISDSALLSALGIAAQDGVEVVIITDRVTAGRFYAGLKGLGDRGARVILKKLTATMNDKYGVVDG